MVVTLHTAHGGVSAMELGNAESIQLIDFGLSRMIQSLQKEGVLVDTPSVWSPRCWRASTTRRPTSGVWANAERYSSLGRRCTCRRRSRRNDTHIRSIWHVGGDELCDDKMLLGDHGLVTTVR